MRLFVSEDYLKQVTTIAGNLDPKELLPHVKEAQDRLIQEVLGSKFYNDLIDDTHVLTANETILISYIKPYLAWIVAHESLPFIHYKNKPKGLIKVSGESNNSADLTELKFILDRLKNRAEQYGQRLQDYLYDNRNLFEYYKNYDCPLAPNRSSTFDCDVVFDENTLHNGITTNDIANYLYRD